MRVKGFSLIELLVVIGIVAVLNIAIFPKFSAIQTTAKEISAKSSARTIMIALEQYYFLYQEYPNGTSTNIYSLLQQLSLEDLIQTDPINPFTGQSYSLSDSSGKILYTRISEDDYQLIGYGVSNEEVIFEYP